LPSAELQAESFIHGGIGRASSTSGQRKISRPRTDEACAWHRLRRKPLSRMKERVAERAEFSSVRPRNKRRATKTQRFRQQNSGSSDCYSI
jgi:hypothetical protein